MFNCYVRANTFDSAAEEQDPVIGRIIVDNAEQELFEEEGWRQMCEIDDNWHTRTDGELLMSKEDWITLIQNSLPEGVYTASSAGFNGLQFLLVEEEV